MTPIDPEIKALQDSIFLSKVARARRTPISERLADGPELFDSGMRWLRDCICSEHPDFTAEQVDRELRRRLKIRKKLDDAGLYRDVGVVDE